MTALVERHAELAVLKAAYHNGGGAVLVTACAGGGKTGLLQTFAEYVDTTGGIVVSMAGSHTERLFGVGVLDQLVTSQALPAETRQRLRDVLDETVRDQSGWDTADEGGDGVAVESFVEALGGALTELARERSVVVCVDDAHFLGEMALGCLLSVQRRVVAAGGVAVFGETVPPAAKHSRVHTELADQPGYQWLRLPLLSRHGVAMAVARRLGDATEDVVEACCEVSGGNPRLVRALLDDHAAADGAAADVLVVGVSFRHAVLACLYRLDSRVLDIARGIAVLDEQVEPERLATLLGMNAGVVRSSADLLAATGLVRAGRFRHPAAREAVLGTLSPEEHTKLAARVAWVLHQDGADAASVGRHLLAAEQAEHPWTVGVLRETAKQALADGLVDTAVRCLDLAVRGSVDKREHAANIARLAAAEWRVNPSAAARHLDVLTRAMRDGLLEPREIVALIKYLLWFGEVDQAADIVDRLVAAGTTLDCHLVAELRVAHRVLYFGDSPMADRLARIGPWPADSDVVTGSAQMAAKLMTSLLGNGTAGRIAADAEQILLNSQVDESSFESVVCALLALVQAGQPRKALEWSARLLSSPTIRGARTWRAVLTSINTHAGVRCGELPPVTALADSVFDTLPAHSWGLAIGLPLADLLQVATASGAVDEAEELLRRVVPDRMVRTWPGLRYLRARGHFHLSSHRVFAALEDFKRCGSLMTAEGVDIPALIPWRSDIAQAYLRLDLREKAKKLVEQQLALPGATNARVRGASLRVLALTTEAPQRQTLLREAVDILRQSGDEFELAMAQSDLNVIDCGSRQSLTPPTPLTRLGTNGRGLPRLDSVPVQSKKDERPRTRPLKDRRLSGAERRVADLVTRGHRNREISTKLHITISTVEQHLTKIYRKVGVSNRNELRAKLHIEPDECA